MGLGFQLRGRCGRKGLLSRVPTPERLLKDFRRAFDDCDWPHPMRTSLGRTREDLPALWVQLHPAAEPLEIEAGPDEGTFTATGATSTVGPGYHIHVCETLRQVAAEIGATFDPPVERSDGGGDETGYFHTRDRDACVWEFLRWLRAVARLPLEEPMEDANQLAISMPLDYGFDADAPVITPMGPRTLDWARAVAEDPEAGVDLFPWYAPGVNARARLGYALHLMWCGVRWSPALTEEDRSMQIDVLENLEAAYREDPTLNYPWREWRELMTLADRENALGDDVRRRAARVPAGRGLIGYRRRPVTRRHAGGWSLKVPGHFVETSDDEETWRAYDETRAVHFSSYVSNRRAGGRPPTGEQILEDAPRFDEAPLRRLSHREANLVARGVLRRYVDEDGEARLQVQGISAVTGRMALTTVDFADERDVEWAIGVWKSVSNPGSGG